MLEVAGDDVASNNGEHQKDAKSNEFSHFLFPWV